MKKRGQIKLSFGMIFSLILIIIFFSVGFYAINKFLNMQDNIKIADFAKDLQSDVDKMWSTSQGSQPAEYRLPNRIDYVCFADLNSRAKGNFANFYKEFERYSEDKNLFLYPLKKGSGLNSFKIINIDLDDLTGSQNPACFKKSDKIKFTLKKEFGETLVKIRD